MNLMETNSVLNNLKRHRLNRVKDFFEPRFKDIKEIIGAYLTVRCDTACCIRMHIIVEDFNDPIDEMIMNHEHDWYMDSKISCGISLDCSWVHLRGRDPYNFIYDNIIWIVNHMPPKAV